MVMDYKGYLEEGTQKIIEILSPLDVSEEEKEAVIKTFSDELYNSMNSAGLFSAQDQRSNSVDTSSIQDQRSNSVDTSSIQDQRSNSVDTSNTQDYRLNSAGLSSAQDHRLNSVGPYSYSIPTADKADSFNYEPILYGTLVKFFDRKLSDVLADQDSSYSTNERAIRFCRRQQDNLALFKSNRWKLPAIENRNMEKCLDTLRKRQDAIVLCSKIANEDKQIDELLNTAQTDLSSRACDYADAKIAEFEEDLALCRKKKVSLPPIKNKDTKTLKKYISDLRKEAERKDSIYQDIYDTDFRIYSIVSLRIAAPEQWQEVVRLCHRQTEALSECSKNRWPLPEIRYENPNEVAARYRHYLEMVSVDSQLVAQKDSLSSKKKYNTFFTNCENQKSNIEICDRNGWDLPDLKVSDPSALMNTVRGEKSKKDRKNKVRVFIITSVIIVIMALGLGIFGIYKYREGKVQIPFDPKYASGQELDDIYDELDHAGFENITKKPDDSGWQSSGEVTGVTIDNSDSYKKGSYKKPDVNVVINYSSDDRVYVTDLLKDWKQADYKTVKAALEKAGITNITVEEVVSSDKEKEKLTAALSLNGEKYTNEACYLPKTAPVVISYYVHKIGIGNDNSQFIGQDYKNVVDSLKESGFTNIQTQKILTGWAKGNSVVGVTVNNVDTYKSSESFDPGVKIVVKYSSDDRTDITPIMENWQTEDYEHLSKALEEKGFTNIKSVSKKTDDNKKNHLIDSVTLNNEKYMAGGCYLQLTAPIKIEYYTLAIEIGNTAAGFKGENYSDIVTQLQKKGFTNISLLRADNLINGWIVKEGSIKEFTIDGSSDFEDTDTFTYDAPIKIVVNTFKDKGCDDITDRPAR